MTISLTTLGALLLGFVVGYVVRKVQAQRRAEAADMAAGRATTQRDGGTGEER